MGDSLRSSSRPAAKITAGEPWKTVRLGAHPTGSCAGTRTSVFSTHRAFLTDSCVAPATRAESASSAAESS